MPPFLALLLTITLVGFLLRRELRKGPAVSKAIWIPVAWFMINGSRQVSQWIGGETGLSAQALAQGNSIDQVAYSVLIAAGALVLVRRRAQLSAFARSNPWFVIFILYAGFSAIWSDFPLTSLKRWVKAVGDPVMVLVLWSEANPVRAVTTTVRRCAYVLIPVSLLFCKYYVELGRVIDSWGKVSYTGVTTDKNMFGYLLFTYGLFFLASVLSRASGASDRRENRGFDRIDAATDLLLLAIIGWLLAIANSKTATLSLCVGVVVLAATRIPNVLRNFRAYALLFVLIVGIGDAVFSIKTSVLEASGRDATFTGRTGLWETVLSEPINPVIGAGYASFWLGERLARFWAMYPTSPPIQAHNGYIEVYLNLGLIGLCLIVIMLWSGLSRVQRRAVSFLDPVSQSTDEHRTFAMFGLSFCTAYLLYNVTEATFQGLNPLFGVFLILTADYSARTRGMVAERFRTHSTLPGKRAIRSSLARARGRR